MRRGCPFCAYAGPSPILWETIYGAEETGPRLFIIEPLNPVAPGHVLVVPRSHVSSAAESPSLTGILFEYGAGWALDHGYPSWNLITSVGRAATQTVDHLHVHVIPRRVDDGLQLPWGQPQVEVVPN